MEFTKMIHTTKEYPYGLNTCCCLFFLRQHILFVNGKGLSLLHIKTILIDINFKNNNIT